jgi:PIN domain nuclease of toxin-antitoxin system
VGSGEVIVLDTHAWIWWVGDRSLLSRRAFDVLMTEPDRAVSTISCWEIAMLVAKGRLTLDRDPLTWFHAAIDSGTRVLPLALEISAHAPTLRGIRDPSDQLIIATALHHRAPLVTKDQRIRDSGLVETIW